MKVKLIYNPVSGSGEFRYYLDYIIEKFQEKGYEVVPFRTKNEESLEKMLSELDKKAYKRILISGGDGTINQVVNGMIRYNIDLPIGLFPSGTANDYARYFNLPDEIEDMVEIALRDNYTLADVGCVDGRYFINVASLGSLIEVGHKVSSQTKNNMGIISYYLKGIEELPKIKPVRVKVNSKDINFDGDIYLMLVMNGRSAGGFKRISPVSSINDGLFDVIIFKKCNFIDFTNLFFNVLQGKHINDPNVLYFQTDELTIDCDENIATDFDGEKGIDFPLKIKSLPQRIKILTRINNEGESHKEKVFSYYDVKKVFKGVSKGLMGAIPTIEGENYKESSTRKNISKLIKELPRHNPIEYINKNSINENYYKIAEETLDNGYMYIVLSSTGSPAGETIRKVTGKEYSHVSLAFDEELKTIISYNGGNGIYSPGLNKEDIEFFHQKEDANIIIYRIKATKEQKTKIFDEIKKINEQGSSYNALGLLLPYSYKDNIMVCSQFVYKMLQSAGLNYFDKIPEKVRPTDFVELDYERQLEYYSKIFIKDILQMG